MVEISRFVLGLAIMIFHRPIADYILHQEQQLAGLLRSRGMNVPALPSVESARNIYFGLGTFICGLELARIWFTLY